MTKRNNLREAIASLKVSEALKIPKLPKLQREAFTPPALDRTDLSTTQVFAEEIPAWNDSNSERSDLSSIPAEIKAISDQIDLSLESTQIKMDGDPIDAVQTINSNQEVAVAGAHRGSLEKDEEALKSETNLISDQTDLCAELSEIKMTSDQSKLRSKRSQRLVDRPNGFSALCREGFDPTPFIPEGRDVQLIEESTGDTYLPHRIYEWMVKVIDSKVELLVFSCMVRNSLGYRRSWCQTSQSFIANWTGLASPNVRRAIKSLLAQKVITRIQGGGLNHDWGVYEIPIIKAYLGGQNGGSKIKMENVEKAAKTQVVLSSDQNDLRSDCTEISDQIKLRTEINLIHNKETKKEEIKSFSLKSFPKELREYFENLKPAKKRENEWNHLRSLSSDFSSEHIAEALRFLLSHGTPSGQPCHSPMAYLSFAMTEVWQEISRRKDKDRRRRENELTLAQVREGAVDSEGCSNEVDLAQKAEAFNRALPSAEAQQKYVASFSGRYPTLNLPGASIRNLAIQCWWSEHRAGASAQSGGEQWN